MNENLPPLTELSGPPPTLSVPKRPAISTMRNREISTEIELGDGLGIDPWYAIDGMLPNWITVVETVHIPKECSGNLRVVVRGHRLTSTMGSITIVYSSDPEHDRWAGKIIRPLSEMPAWLSETVDNLARIDGGPGRLIRKLHRDREKERAASVQEMIDNGSIG